MTKDEIMNMEAGIEMDKIVAEQVIGWHIATKDYGWKFWADKDGVYAHGINQNDDGFEDEEDFHILHFHPSGSILAAWEVVEKMEENDWWWKASNVVPNSDPIAYEFAFDKGGDRNFYVCEMTLPLAICKSALLTTLEGE